jgi:hypothetical protein
MDFGGYVYYREVQRFRQKLLWIMIIVVDVLLVTTFSYDFYQRIYLDGQRKPWCQSSVEEWQAIADRFPESRKAGGNVNRSDGKTRILMLAGCPCLFCFSFFPLRKA